MKQLYERVWDFYRKFSEAAGPFVLFGLFEREEAAGRWDLVVSAEWLKDRSKEENTRLLERFFAELQAHLGPELVVTLSRVALLDPQDAFVRALDGIRVKDGALRVDTRLRVDGTLKVDDHWIEMRDCSLNGMAFRHVVVYEYDPESAGTRGEAAAAV